MTEAKGPLFAAGFEIFADNDYSALFLPDVNNEYLQREGKAPVFHYLPQKVRLARKPNGDFNFHLVHFEGIRGENTNVGVTGTEEITGGLVGFSTTCAFPTGILKSFQDQLLEKFKGSPTPYWGWRVPVKPEFRPAPIVSNVTTLTNLSPTASGGVPQPTAPQDRNRGIAMGLRSMPARSPALPPISIPRGYRASNLDHWYVNLQGQGPGSINPLAENAYSGLVGSIPAAILWGAFHGGSSAIAVWQNLRLKVWSPIVELRIEGEWSRIQDHFSAAAHGGGWFWSADIKAQFNNLRASGDIKVSVSVDPTLPGADKISEAIDKRTDLVYQKFMEQAQKTIFDVVPYKEDPAVASGGFLGLGGGVALKLRRDQVSLSLRYYEKREMAYLQETQISGNLEGLADDIAADPQKEKRYFTTLYLADWERKVSRVIKPVVNWPDNTRKWVGEPVSFLSVQVGYPDTRGAIQWDGHVFQPNDPTDAHWQTAIEMKRADDVVNAPAGWSPDQTFVKRAIHFAEPPSDLENPYVRMAVEKNVVELDPGERGTLMSDINLEVRVDTVGVLDVGPIMLNVDLENSKQYVEVTFKADGRTDAGIERTPTVFRWGFDDQYEPRYWRIYTGQPSFAPSYQYQVRVVVKGSIMTKGMEWIGPWQPVKANGPIMISVPTQEDPGVTITRAFRPEEISAPHAGVTTQPAIAAPPATPSLPAPGVIAPPPSRQMPGTATPSRGFEGYSSEHPLTRGAPPSTPYAQPIRSAPPSMGASGTARVQGYSISTQPATEEGWNSGVPGGTVAH